MGESPLVSMTLKMQRTAEIRCFFFSILLVSAVVPSHQRMITEGDALRLWRRGRRYNSRTLQTVEWESDKAPVSFRNDSEYLTESKAQGDLQEADYLPQGLPGQPKGYTFKQYSGYVNIDVKVGRALFYYFAEANEDPSTKPLILWLNGGPGCSSFGYGALHELGPFRVKADGKTLYYNRHAWNRVANVLFLETPAGVGFSYSNRSADYDETGDKRTAEQSYAFLVNWFDRFPKYKNRKFYIAGESYAGYFVPELAATILDHQKLKQGSFINLKGVIVGNGLLNAPTDYVGTFTYPWTHAIISDESYERLVGNCTKANYDASLCDSLESEMYAEMGDININNLYAPICLPNSSKNAENVLPGYDPCINNHVSTYLNTPEVQKELHANVTHLDHMWTHCSNVLHWTDSPSTVLPIYRRLIENGLGILLYSGDMDSNVPVTATRLSINELKLPIRTSWYPWIHEGEVGGYSVIYKGLTFATVRGAGHEVPEYQSSRALAMVTFFLRGKPLPQQ